jgi:exodeoxyribonuclease VII large subunit
MADLPNTPEFSVSEIAGAVKSTLESAFGRVRVRGEITELKAYASGHVYFALKDEGAKIRAIIWRGAAARVGLKPENGVEVIATGKITSYPERSEYQLIVDRLEYAGAGALLARIEMLKARLAAEGLFATERKRPLPMLPRIIGVISSPQGAVLQDIKTTIARRFPTTIILWPVPVQGEGAAEKIAAAIAGFSNLPAGGPIPRPDVLIVARGGGSLEDLMAFNDEVLVRAAAGCTIPLISAVGHETDTTLIDFVSDRRAPTPTAAAEMAIPARLDLLADLAQKTARLAGALSRITSDSRLRLDRADAKLPDLPGILGAARQRVDDRAERLTLALPNFLAGRRSAQERLAGRLIHPREFLLRRGGDLSLLLHRLSAAWPQSLRQAQKSLDNQSARLTNPAERLAAGQARIALLNQRLAVPLPGRLREASLRLGNIGARLDAVSYQSVLARGFALVTNARGAPVSSAAAVVPGAALNLKFADGDVAVKAAPVQGTLGF